VFLTAAVPFGKELPPVPDNAPGAHDNATVTREHRFLVFAVDLGSGAIVWERTVREALPHETYHVSGSIASASPVTDGELLYASFGSHGLYCLTLDGELVWEQDFGEMQVKHAHGEGASPALFDGTLVVAWDHEGDSFLVALDGETGEERWRTARDEPTSWATPIVVEHDERAQVIVSGTNRLRGYDLSTGVSIWECGGLSQNIVASPVAADGLVVAGSSYERQAMLAIRLDGAKGDLTVSDKLAWMRRRRTPYVPSPLLVDGSLYFLHHYQNTLSRVELATGEEPAGPSRLPGIGSVYASPVAAAGRVYVTDLSGATLVLSDAAQPEVLALNQLDDSFSASAAIAGDAILLRGRRHLYCLAED
jgi:outer membrane protein assembly factor BamB